MTALAVTLVVYGLVLAGAFGWISITARRRSPRVIAAVVLVQVATMLLVVVDAIRSIGDRGGADLIVHLAYLATAVIVLPVSFTVAGADRTRWGNAAMSVACVLLSVVVVRVQQTAVTNA